MWQVVHLDVGPGPAEPDTVAVWEGESVVSWQFREKLQVWSSGHLRTQPMRRMKKDT